MERWVTKIWYQGGAAKWLIAPLSLLYGFIVKRRRAKFLAGKATTETLAAPVVVVGNITAGGTGKTPLVVWLVTELRRKGYRPGIVSRGYRGAADSWPQKVTSTSDPKMVGDEPVMLASRCGCPVAAGPDRIAAGELLIAEGVNAIVADDGLQHYRLHRDCEIAVVDGERQFGNGLLLPAGPLREPVSRLSEVDVVVINGTATEPHHLSMKLRQLPALPIHGGDPKPVELFNATPVHAVAGIGNPDRFFGQLEKAGLEIIQHVHPDHHGYEKGDICFSDNYPVLMTEKDAVKCRQFADARHWYVPLEPSFAQNDANVLLDTLSQRFAKANARQES
ncbi:MAG: tetraacyldisaccharide 4'-kinase [Pseudomonadota bacterium]